MAGKIIADTLETGAGADIATSYVVNGSAKAWINYDGSSVTDPASLTGVNGSFNISSVLDNTTGDHSPSLTNAMSNSNYSACSNIQENFMSNAHNVRVSSSSFRQYLFYVNHPGSNNPAVDTQADTSIHGDLA